MRRTFLLLALAGAAPLAAQQPQPDAPFAYRQLADPDAEARAHALMLTIRCIQCQGQSIADSDAPIALTMRSEIRQRIAAGEQPAEIRAWLIERYGRFVSYLPQADGLGWPLYVLPVLALVIGIVLASSLFRRGKAR